MSYAHSKTLRIVLGVTLVTVFALLGIILSYSRPVAASAPTGMQAQFATSSGITANPTSVFTAFATSTCTSRVVTTKSNPVMFLFGDQATTTSGTNGHLQPASTTVAYDAGLYGCDKWTVFGFGSEVQITVTEFRGFK